MNRLIPVILLVAGAACSTSAESPRYAAEVVVPAGPLTTVTNDLGWQVETTRAEISFRDLDFTTRGEAHASLVPQWLVGTAYAHPGHLADGDVIGSLGGAWTVDFATGDVVLGEAAMIAGKYEGLNFRFSQPSAGATIQLAGTATKNDLVVAWSADVAHDDGRRVTGVALDRVIEGDGEQLRFAFLPADPTTGATLYDGIDFGEGPHFEVGSPTSNRLTRATQRHDFWLCD